MNLAIRIVGYTVFWIYFLSPIWVVVLFLMLISEVLS